MATRREAGQVTESQAELSLVDLAKVEEVELPKGLNPGDISGVRAAVEPDPVGPEPESAPTGVVDLQLVHSATGWGSGQRLLAALALVLLSPLFLLCGVAIKVTSRGPFLFRQRRRGQGGEPITIFKMRTTRVGTNRTTAVGRLLRRLRLDEIPLLWSIVRGDMELVGPRTIPMALETELRKVIPEFRERSRVKPGLTSFSRVVVFGESVDEQLVKDCTERFRSELHYVRHKSFGYDVVVLCFSVLFVLRSMLGVFGRRRPAAAAPSPASVAPATSVLGVPISNVGTDEVLNLVGGFVQRQEPRFVCVASAHGVLEGFLSEPHRAALAAASVTTAGAWPVVWAQRLLGHGAATRVDAPALMLKALQKAEWMGWRVAFYGGRADRIVRLVDRMKLRFPKLEIVATISSPPRELTPEEDAEFVQQLHEAEVDLLLVGLDSPDQERWMQRNVGRLRATMLGVGAAFDVHARTLPKVPWLIGRLGLGPLYTVCCDPRRLLQRYVATLPLYIALLTGQVLQRVLLFRCYQLAPRAGE